MKHTTDKRVSKPGPKLRLELVRSTCNTPDWMRVIVRTLALRKMRDVVLVGDNPAIRGMVAKVPHLVQMTEVKE
jgi:large subunit ribosomal protein L30